MTLQQLIASLTPEVYANLQRAIEIGKWPDGRVLTKEQRELCMQAVIAWEHKHLPPEEHTGFIPPKPHSHCGNDDHDHSEPAPLKWL